MRVFKKGLLTTAVKHISAFIVKYSWVFVLLLVLIIGGFLATKKQDRHPDELHELLSAKGSVHPGLDPYGQRFREGLNLTISR
jgi:hypothetical protein